VRETRHEKFGLLLVRQSAESLEAVWDCLGDQLEIVVAGTGREAAQGREILLGGHGEQMEHVDQRLYQTHCHSSYLTGPRCLLKQQVEGTAAWILSFQENCHVCGPTGSPSLDHLSYLLH
jgi:hypothetical protein